MKLTSCPSETELKDTVHQRDEILKDRFDHLIETCPVLDIEEAIKVEDFFQRVAVVVADALKMSVDAVFDLLLEREQESSTALNAYLAIPHIAITGEKHFGILIARCRDGIEFSEAAPRVHAAFVLIGTRNERTFHLISLAAVARTVQEDGFEEKWMAAESPQALRDLVLSCGRKRQL
ncbi:MAG: PTS sugar transporter subunit IIA [Sedimentisphaerales bacterium]|nr:PTS sugar transporter subunit IIA [Sedimentisphaerales bacterium]